MSISHINGIPIASIATINGVAKASIASYNGIALPASGPHFQVDTGGTLTTGLVSYYKMEDATDFYGTNNGTASNVSWTTGKVNNAGSFNGSSSRISTASTPFNFGTGNFSLACWIKPTSFSSNGDIIFDKGVGGVGGQYWVRIENTSGDIRFMTYDGSAATQIDGSSGLTRLTTGSWQHIVAVRNGTTLSLYKNGTLTESVTGTVRNTDNTIAMYLGGPNQDTGYWDGLLDEMGVWSKALSTTEITDLYNSGNGQTMVS